MDRSFDSRLTSPSKLRRQLRTMMTQPEVTSSALGLEGDALGQNDEMREIAVQLSVIRKRHDEASEANALMRAQLQRMKLEIESLDTSKQLNETDSLSVQHKIDQLTLVLDSVKLKHEEEIAQKKIYEHMLDRMKLDLVSQQIKTNEVATHLKSARHTLDTQKEKTRRIKEAKFQSSQLLNEFREVTEYGRRKREESLLHVEKNLQMREDVALRREERKQRQADIAEAAASDDKDANEIRAKDSIWLHRLWYRRLKYRLEVEREGSRDIEGAYRQIRMLTGVDDIHQITQDFRSREQTYQDLLTAVNDSETKLDQLHQENTVARSRLKDLQLVEVGATGETADVVELRHKVAEQTKTCRAAELQLQDSVLIYNSVLDWARKIMRKLDPTDAAGGLRATEDSYKDHGPIDHVQGYDRPLSKSTLMLTDLPISLLDLFTKILAKTEELCSELGSDLGRTREEMEVLAGKKTDQLVVRATQGEISTAEFLAKNIRVRPLGDDSEGGDDEDMSQFSEKRRKIKRDLLEKEENVRRRRLMLEKKKE